MEAASGIGHGSPAGRAVRGEIRHPGRGPAPPGGDRATGPPPVHRSFIRSGRTPKPP